MRRYSCRTRWSSALLLTGALAFAACGDSPTPPQGPVVASIGVEPSAPDMLVGGTVQLTATARDAAGVPITGRTVSWNSENLSVATVSTGGSVNAVAPGTARITASVDGQVGAATVTVTLPAVASVTVTPVDPTIGLGGSVQLTATLRDANNTVLTGRTVTWSSTQEGTASVDGNGVVRGHAPGSVIITAAAGGVTGTTQVVVTSTPAVIITGVSPATIQEGQSATITGTGFSADAHANTVLIDDVPATVTAATATSLTITVPQGRCLPARSVSLRIAVGGNVGERMHPWRPATFLDVPVGQQVRLSGTSPCIQLDGSTGSAEFLVGVQSVSSVATQVTPVVVRGTTGTPASLSFAAAVMAPQHVHAGAATPLSAFNRRLQRHREAELAFRHEERRTMQRQLSLAERRFTPRNLAASSAEAAVPPDAAMGDTVVVKYPTAPNLCELSVPVTAVVRHRGTRGIWLEDVNNPAGGFTQADYAQLGGMFDQHIYPANVEYFGEPTDFDANGRIVILITRELNREETALGRMVFADLFPGECPGGNGGEFFYGIAPDPAGTIGFEYTVEDARLDYPIIIGHELAHVIQVGRRLMTPGATSFQTVWELEGQATLAEEIVGHRITGNQPGQNYGFSVAWNTPEVHAINWYISAFVDLALYFGFESVTGTIPNAPERCGWLGVPTNGSMGPCIGSRSVYGVSWSFLRWVTDQYGPSFPGGEAGLHRAMVTDTRTGFATISGLTGRPIDEMLAQWAATLYMDGRIPSLDPRLTFTSWDLHGGADGVGPRTGVFANLIPTAQLRPRENAFTSFQNDISVIAGSTAYFRLSGSSRPAMSISVRDTGGGAVPGHMRVWIVRVR
jgi:hypothetical protein